MNQVTRLYTFMELVRHRQAFFYNLSCNNSSFTIIIANLVEMTTILLQFTAMAIKTAINFVFKSYNF